MTHDCRETHDETCGVPECRWCRTALHDGGDICIECWRDRRDLALARDRDWEAS